MNMLMNVLLLFVSLSLGSIHGQLSSPTPLPGASMGAPVSGAPVATSAPASPVVSQAALSQASEKAIRKTSDTVIPKEDDAGMIVASTPKVKEWFSASDNFIKKIDASIREIEKVRNVLNKKLREVDAELDSFLIKAGQTFGASEDVYQNLAREAIARIIERRKLKKDAAQVVRDEQSPALDPAKFSKKMNLNQRDIKRLERRVEELDDKEDELITMLKEVGEISVRAAEESTKARKHRADILKSSEVDAKSHFDSIVDSSKRLKKMENMVQRSIKGRFDTHVASIVKHKTEIETALAKIKTESSEVEEQGDEILRQDRVKVRKEVDTVRKKKVPMKKKTRLRKKGKPEEGEDDEQVGVVAQIARGAKNAVAGVVGVVQNGFNTVMDVFFGAPVTEEEAEEVMVVDEPPIAAQPEPVEGRRPEEDDIVISPPKEKEVEEEKVAESPVEELSLDVEDVSLEVEEEAEAPDLPELPDVPAALELPPVPDTTVPEATPEVKPSEEEEIEDIDLDLEDVSLDEVEQKETGAAPVQPSVPDMPPAPEVVPPVQQPAPAAELPAPPSPMPELAAADVALDEGDEEDLELDLEDISLDEEPQPTGEAPAATQAEEPVAETGFGQGEAFDEALFEEDQEEGEEEISLDDEEL